MRRMSVLVSVFVIALIGMAAVLSVPSAVAQDATPVAAGDHPLIGTWLIDSDSADPENSPSINIFSADGGFIEYDGFDVSLGRWEATGAQTGDLTFVGLGIDPETDEYQGMFKVRASIEVAADGQSLTAEYTGEFMDADGNSDGEYGPGQASATRISVEPMGTPVGTFEDLFEQFEEDSTPAP